MEERLTYLVTSSESIFRKRHVTTFMASCKNRIYPQCKFPTDVTSKSFQLTHALMFHTLRCVEMLLLNEWVSDNTGANSGSSIMSVAPIDHHCRYGRRLSTYDPRLVGRSMSTKLTEPRFRCAWLVFENVFGEH